MRRIIEEIVAQIYDDGCEDGYDEGYEMGQCGDDAEIDFNESQKLKDDTVDFYVRQLMDQIQRRKRG